MKRNRVQTTIWRNTSSSPDEWNLKKSQQQATGGPPDTSGVWTFCKCAPSHVVKTRRAFLYQPSLCFVALLQSWSVCGHPVKRNTVNLWAIQSFFLEGLFPISPLKIKVKSHKLCVTCGVSATTDRCGFWGILLNYTFLSQHFSGSGGKNKSCIVYWYFKMLGLQGTN